jgi:tRNA pseudouridine55 synthase
MTRRQRGRDVNGMIVVDKPGGASSNDAVQWAKQLYRAQKVGHTGSLEDQARCADGQR